MAEPVNTPVPVACAHLYAGVNADHALLVHRGTPVAAGAAAALTRTNHHERV
jgi:hypothetical protein